jgi:hypothetical protein
MSDLIEKMARELRFALSGRYDDWQSCVPKVEIILTLLTKPENISLEMCVAYEIASDGGSREAVLRWFDMHPNQLVRAQECLAAAITAALQDNTEEKKTS